MSKWNICTPSLSFGNLLKINRTGGTESRMFNVIEKSNGGFKNYNEDDTVYMVGSHKFDSPIRYIKHIHGLTFLCFENGKILKINGSGGAGDNLFKIIETQSGFNTLPGYTHYSGHDKFLGRITNISNIKYDNEYRTFFCFDNGKVAGEHILSEHSSTFRGQVAGDIAHIFGGDGNFHIDDWLE